MSPSKRRRQLLLLVWPFLFAGPGFVAHAEDIAEVHLVGARGGPIAALTRDEAEQLYLGRKTTLADGTPVALIDLPAGHTRDRMYFLLTGKNPIQTRAYWSRQVFTGRAKPPREAVSAEQAINWIATTPGTIGYLPANLLDNRVQSLIRLP